MTRFWLIVSAAVLLTTVGCAHGSLVARSRPPTGGYLIREVRVFTGDPASPVLEQTDVLLVGDRIQAIGVGLADVAGSEVIDGREMTLLPGLVDSHTHVTGGTIIPWKLAMLPTMKFSLRGALYAGITTIVDMSGFDTERMNQLAESLETGRLLGPHLFHAGMGFTGEGCHPIPYRHRIEMGLAPPLRSFVPQLAVEVADPQDLDALEDHLDADPDFTKVFLDSIPHGAPVTDAAILAAIVARSHARGIGVAVHIGSNEDVIAVLDAGADGLAHGVYKEAIDPSLPAALAEAGTFVIPTAVVFETYHLFVNEHDVQHYSDLEWVTTHPSRVQAMKHPRETVSSPEWARADEVLGRGMPYLHSNTAALHAAGVTILAGSDSPNLGLALGGSLHEELQHLVTSGLTPVEALMAATSTPAQVWSDLTGRERDFGTVEPGKRADLLLVRGDPTADITTTRQIEEVFLGGVRLKRR